MGVFIYFLRVYYGEHVRIWLRGREKPQTTMHNHTRWTLIHHNNIMWFHIGDFWGMGEKGSGIEFHPMVNGDRVL